jgi:hypothetical protein
MRRPGPGWSYWHVIHGRNRLVIVYDAIRYCAVGRDSIVRIGSQKFEFFRARHHHLKNQSVRKFSCPGLATGDANAG